MNKASKRSSSTLNFRSVLKLGLRQKLLMMLVVLISIVVFAIQYIAISQTGAALEEAYTTDLITEATKTGQAVDSNLAGVERVLSTLAVSPELEDYLSRYNEGEVNPERIYNMLYNVTAEQNDIETIVVLDLSGICIADNEHGNLFGLDLSDRTYFQAIVDAQHTSYVDDVITSRATGNRVFTYSIPLYDAAGELAGVIGAVLNFEEFVLDFTQTINTGSTGMVKLVSTDGQILHHPDSEQIGEDFLQGPLGVEVVRLESGAIPYVSGEYESDGVGRFYNASRLVNWYLVLTRDQSEVFATLAQTQRSGYLTGFVFVLISCALGFVFANRITSPLFVIRRVLQEVGNGDLTQSIEIKSKDEIGELAEAINTMVIHQREIVAHVMESAQSVTAASEELAAAVEQNTTSMEEISVAVESEVAQNAQQIALSTDEARSKSKETWDAALSGTNAVEEAGEAMVQIDSSTHDVSEVIGELYEASGKIGVIINTITEIAEQTNLLALNAAIEAARAGEQGRGFAVVAEEVRKLAEGSSRAAGEIGELITDIQSRTEKAVGKMSDANALVERGSQLSQNAKQHLSKIDAAISDMVGLVDEIASSAQEQSASAEEIAASTQEQTGILQEVSATTTELAQMAEKLAHLVDKFTL